MTVRWRPLIILSGLFVTVALVGLVGFVMLTGPKSAEELLDQARAARSEGRLDFAETYYRKALMRDSKNAAIYLELAACLEDRIDQATTEAKPKLEVDRLSALVNAAQYGATALEPRRLLLDEALRNDGLGEQYRWAREVVSLDPNDPNAQYVVARHALATTPPELGEARDALERLENVAPDQLRTRWVATELAILSQDEETIQTLLDPSILESTPADEPLIDQSCRLDLLVLRTDRLLSSGNLVDENTARDLIAPTIEVATKILNHPDLTASQVVEVASHAKSLRTALQRIKSDQTEELLTPLAVVVEQGFRAILERGDEPRLWVHRALAEHLRDRGLRDQSLKVVEEALALSSAGAAGRLDEALALRETAVKTALSDPTDPDRYAKAEPHLEALVESAKPGYEGIGHLFNGAIALERSGLTEGLRSKIDPTVSESELKKARDHLAKAVELLPDVVTARALYGITLNLSGEPALGRQYLLEANRMGLGEPRYIIWAAWSLLNAGYPEEAAPITKALRAAVNRGDLDSSLDRTLSLLEAEVAQRGRAPENLEVARATYQNAISDGEEPNPAIALRLVELTMATEGPEAGLQQIETLASDGLTGPGHELLGVVALIDLDRAVEAETRLQEARRAFPDDEQLVMLEARLAVEDEKAEHASELLDHFVNEHPKAYSAAQLRAQVLADALDQPEKARQLLKKIAETSKRSSPLIQLATIEINGDDWPAAERVIAEIRGRWPEAASADLLEAQLNLARKDFNAARESLQSALKRDPSNKVALYWQAQLDGFTGSTSRAQETLEAIVRQEPVKQLSADLSLMTAAQYSLASLAMERDDFDGAITQLREVLASEQAGSLERSARWSLITALAEQGNDAEARTEIVEILKEPDVTLDEYIRAAEFFRKIGEPKIARSLLDRVFEHTTYEPAALVVSAYLFVEDDRAIEATQQLEDAVQNSEQPATVYLLLAGLKSDDNDPVGSAGAVRQVLEEGIQAHPDSIDLVRMMYRLILENDGEDAALGFARDRARIDGPSQESFQRFLIEANLTLNRLDKAEALTLELLQENPEDPTLAASVIGIEATRAIQAARRNDREAERASNAKTERLILQYRDQFPTDPRFPEAAAQLAMRRGKFVEAESLAREIEEIAPESVMGPLIRASISRAQGHIDRAIEAYREALSLRPQRDDIRITLGRVLLDQGRAAEASVEAARVLAKDPGRRDAILLRAAALAAQPGSDEHVATNRAEAISLLNKAIENDPRFVDGYAGIAQIRAQAGEFDQAIAALEAGHEAVPSDSNTLSVLIEYLAKSQPEGSAELERDLRRAAEIATNATTEDAGGFASLAIAVGYHRGGRPDLAKPWIDLAAERMENGMVQMTRGDILLAIAESTDYDGEARPYFEEAVKAYRNVLALNADSIEAVNNIAWILHAYLDRDREAIELAEGLADRLDRRRLPPEFLDTLGAIQMAVGRTEEAESTLKLGIQQSPDHPVLNYHMGRLIAMDPTRTARAERYLRRALDGRERLNEAMIRDTESLLERVGR